MQSGSEMMELNQQQLSSSEKSRTLIVVITHRNISSQCDPEFSANTRVDPTGQDSGSSRGRLVSSVTLSQYR